MSKTEKITIGPFTLDGSRLTNSETGLDKNLSKMKTKILFLLFSAHKEGKEYVPRRVILKIVWGDDSYFNSRSMDVMICQLRKIFDYPLTIETVFGEGFKLDMAKTWREK